MNEFVRKTTLNSELVAKSMAKYRHLLVNDARREMRRVGTGLRRLVQSSSRQQPKRMSLAQSPSDEHSEAVWCNHGPLCKSCPHLTHALEAMATAMTSLSDIYADHGTASLTPLVEQMGDWSENMESRAAYMLSVHEGAARIGQWIARKSKKHRSYATATVTEGRPLSNVSTASSTLSSLAAAIEEEGQESTKEAQIQAARLHVMSRLQTVFNTTHAEMDHWFHQERAFEFAEMAEHWIESEMQMLEQCMTVIQGCHRIIKSSVQRMHDADRV
jgi:hypothetical protein